MLRKLRDHLPLPTLPIIEPILSFSRRDLPDPDHTFPVAGSDEMVVSSARGSPGEGGYGLAADGGG
jgi:hypothetical protein